MVYEGIAIIFMGLVIKGMYWEEWGTTLIMSMMVLFGIAWILSGSVLVVRYDDHGNRRHPGQEETTVESPQSHYVREAGQGTPDENDPMHPGPRAYPLAPLTVSSSPDAPPPRTYSKEVPGKCAECGGTLFIGRTNCPHCSAPVPSRRLDIP